MCRPPTCDRFWSSRAAWIALIIPIFASATTAESTAQVQPARPDGETRVPGPVDGPFHYPVNREPLIKTPFARLPVGAVRPRGWLRKQLELQNAGFHGHLGELSGFLRKEGNAWLSKSGEGDHGWEEVPYWLKGFGDCAYLLGDESQIREARVWIEGAIASQDETGFFGPRPGTKTTVGSTQGKYDLWPNMVMLCCLQSHHEFTGDPRVIELMTRYFRWELQVPEEEFLPPFWQQQRAGDNLWSVHWLYNRTGEKWLLDLARKIHRRTAPWSDGIANWHNVNMSQAFGGPAFFYAQSRLPRHFEAAERNWRTMRKEYGQVPGGMFGGDENCRPGFSDPRQAIETCGMVEMMFSCERLIQATGDPVWADRCEDVAFNSLPAALTADLMALRYLTSPNMVLSDRHDKSPGLQNGGPMLHMDPYNHRCCQHNFGHGWPYFVEHLWMAAYRGGLAAVMYGPCDVTAKVGPGEGVEASIQTDTHYPFENGITFRVTVAEPVEFPLVLRVPEWCEQAGVTVNGDPIPTRAGERFLHVARTWKTGDLVTLALPAKVRLRTWEANHNSLSIDAGPLTYSLKIGERYAREGGSDRWPAWEIHPTTPWNYALEVDAANPESSFEIVRRAWPGNELPFTHEGTPIEVRASGRKVPEWQSDERGLVGLLQASPVRTEEPIESITLIPMGAARLRIASFPVVGKGPDATAWKAPPRPFPYRASASHCNDSDTVSALEDRLVPERSGDTSLRRFTWWDHRGTREWVQYEFEKRRAVSAVAVYWFDDTGIGQCRVPASCRLLYQDGAEWRPVPSAAPVGVDVDRWNRVAFPEITTSGLRLEVQLRESYSGGILEWRVEPEVADSK
ncbi:MAG: transcriptional initiation protein Tat [Planctomycetes bacterium]|nr:transcriptional initiation protein Tat [Planctomycetota bacterium]